MPIDLMSLVEGGAPPLPGRRPKSSGNLFANKELMAMYEKKETPEKPIEPPKKKWTPPPKQESDNDDGRKPWDPPARKASWHRKSSDAPVSPSQKDIVKASDPSSPCRDEELAVSQRLADNPFMRRDSNSGVVNSSLVKRPEAYPIISTVERLPSHEVSGKEAELKTEEESTDAIESISQLTLARPTLTKPEPAATEPVPKEPTPAENPKVPSREAYPETAASVAPTALQQTEREPVTTSTPEEENEGAAKPDDAMAGIRTAEEITGAAGLLPQSKPPSLGKSGSKKSMGSLFSMFSPRSQRNS